MDRIVAEHQQFSQSVKDLQDWVADAVHMLDSYSHPTADKSVLDSRMLKLEVWKQEFKTCSLLDLYEEYKYRIVSCCILV